MRRLDRIGRSRLALLGLAFAAVILVSVNLFAGAALRGWRLDLTEERLYTLTGATRAVLNSIEEPIRLRLYYSDAIGEAAPNLALYHDRIRSLLARYRDMSGGRLIVESVQPEPFSDAEDAAVAAGLRGVPVNETGDLAYFGLVGTNAVDGREVIPFFSPQREAFIEYDLTRTVHSLAAVDKPVVGLFSTLPLDGGSPMMGGTPWVVMDLIREVFTVRDLGTGFAQVPEDVDVLMIVHPHGLDAATLYAIDQFVLGGGRALVFVDANAETAAAARGPMGMGRPGPSDFDRILAAWGLRLVADKVAGDLDTARRVSAQAGGRMVISDYVAWLNLGPDNMDLGDAVTGDLKSVNVATAGILEAVEGTASRVAPLIRTGPRAMPIEAGRVRFAPDVAALFRDFQPQGTPLMLAARIGGEAVSIFPDGPPPDEGQAQDADLARRHLDRSVSPLGVIVVSDADMLYDQFWVRVQDLLGQKLLLPFANNGDMVVGALENLVGGAALSGLRARGRADRPFTRVGEIRREAELRFRTQERDLLDKLTDLERKLRTLGGDSAAVAGAAEPGAELLLSAGDKAALDGFKREMIGTRKALRDVQLALRRDIDVIERWVKFVNIAAMPLAVGGAMLLVIRRRRAATRGRGTPP